MLERELQQEVMLYASRKGWFVVALKLCSKKGMPDCLFARKPDGVMLVEVKRKGEYPCKQQLKRHRELRAHGVVVRVVDNMEDAKRILE